MLNRLDYTSIEIKNEEGKANVQGKEEAKMIKSKDKQLIDIEGNKMRSSMGQENFRMTGKVVKNNPGTETFSSRAKQNSRISEKNNTVKKRKRDEIMTPKTPNDHTFSKNWGKTINTEKVGWDEVKVEITCWIFYGFKKIISGDLYKDFIYLVCVL